MKKMDIYLKESHDFALKQLLERFLFEINISKKLFKNNDISLEKLISDFKNTEVFSSDEYIKVYKQALKKLNK